MNDKVIKNKETNPRKIVGFEPANDFDNSQIETMFAMDEELPKSVQNKTSNQDLLASNQAMGAPVNINIYHQPATSPLYINRAISKRPSISTSIGSPSDKSMSYVEKLFPHNNRTNSSLSVEEESVASTNSQDQKAKRVQKKPSGENQKPPAAPKGDNPNAPKSQKNMTKAERRALQEEQRAAKAARVAAGLPAKAPQQKSKPKYGSSPPKILSEQSLPSSAYRGAPPNKKQMKKLQSNEEKNQKSVTLFSHLTPYEDDINALIEKYPKIHPAVISLGVQYANGTIVGGNARCMAMLLAFSKVISDYQTPPDSTLSRHLITYISKQIDFISNTRSLAASMKTAIRFLKHLIPKYGDDYPDEDAKKKLCDSINEFIDTRINFAQNAIVLNTLDRKKIKNGDVIMTFASGLDFKVIVADSRPKLEGRETVVELSRAGIKCTYILSNAVPSLMKEVTKVIVGASSVLSNGDVMARVGTSIVCMAAYDARVPVMVLCEVYKFSDNVRLDSFVWNELGIYFLMLGNPDDLIDISNRAPHCCLPKCIPVADLKLTGYTPGELQNWKEIDKLKLLNLSYDITPSKFVTMVVCELGQIPSTLVLSVLRNQIIAAQ
ncbi:Eukaryotic translation initiation factor 2B, subunit 4 delta, 67kDa [Boothiomyces macroporosus]|uniref:Translation initiation factor eIF2B subunit delta n=1 Tax=Boothiomyces macroporosus TaxID=261099 RepID=A0AAD5Y8J1_9FUNG|nr:Eukaryotic translation initiation factor 2B, subunit 4 delta, 67kDa [Boothiomyces macroporosus]